LYFDFPNLGLYLDHHNGIRSRYKIRFREYSDTGQVFLEVKEKNNKDRTLKTRICVENIESELTERSVQFIEKYTGLDARQLKPSIWTKFARITLVDETDRERITIDINLRFEGSSDKIELPFLVISEVKLDRFVGMNKFAKILKENNIYPGTMSKYGIGTALLNPGIKQNRFKEKIIKLNKLRNVTGSYSVAG